MYLQTFLRNSRKSPKKSRKGAARFEDRDPLVEFVFSIRLEDEEEYLLETSDVRMALFIPEQGASLNLHFIASPTGRVEQVLTFAESLEGKETTQFLSADIISLEILLYSEDSTLVKEFELQDIKHYDFMKVPILLPEPEIESFFFFEED